MPPETPGKVHHSVKPPPETGSGRKGLTNKLEGTRNSTGLCRRVAGDSPKGGTSPALEPRPSIIHERSLIKS